MMQRNQEFSTSGGRTTAFYRIATLLFLAVMIAVPSAGQFSVPAIPSNGQLSNQYEFDAEYIYRVSIEGSFLEDGAIVAYVDGELRGAQSASELFPGTGEVVYKVRVFSDNAAGDTVTFRYFDVFDEKVYDISEYEIFSADHVPDYATPTILNAVCGDPGIATGLLPEDGAGGQNATLDLYWQPSENTLRYALYLWKEGEAVPGTPYANNLYSTSRRVYNLDHGATYNWFVVSVNQCLEDTSATHSFTVRELPDLVVTSMEAPDTVVSATPFALQYTVTNQGDGPTRGVSWNDGFYVSGDDTWSGDDLYLGQLSKSLPVAPDSSYSGQAMLNLPADYSGVYYLFAVTDRSNRIAETDNDNVSQPLAIEVIEKPLPDVAVEEIAAGRIIYKPGDTIDVSWTVSNIGDATASGGWTEKVSIVSLSGVRVNLDGTPQFTGELEQGGDLVRMHSFRVPEVMRFAGEAYVEVELVPSDALEEYPGDDANNHGASLNRITVRNKLYIEIPDEASESYGGQLRSYITRSGNYAQALTVSLAASASGQLAFPSVVTIPERSSSAVFNITMVDNAMLDGPRNVDVTANAAGFDPVTGTIRVLDNEKPTLSLALSAANANEGDTLTLTVSRDLVTEDSAVVYLSTAKSSQWTFPAQAVIAGNEASTEVSLHITDDATPEPDVEVTIKARSDGMISGSAVAKILDDDVPGIELEILADSVSEGAGPYATFGVIRRTGEQTGSVRVRLTADLADVLYFPSTVDLPEGAMERQFNIGAVDNGLVDGYRTVEITGGIYLSSCNCTTTPDNGGAVSGTLTVIDNDGPSLTVTASPVSLREGLADAGTMTIFRNTATDNPLNLQLSSSDTTELTVPATTTIPAGESTVDVTITTKDDGDDDGSQMVTLKAAAAGFAPGVGWVNVTDINRPDLEMGDMELTGNEVVAGRQVEIRTTIYNNGYGKAPYGVPFRFYLSDNGRIDDNDSVIFEGTLDGPVEIGGTFDIVELVGIPRMTGTYQLLGKINPDADVTELLYTNNESGPVELTLIPAYSGTAIVDEESFNEPVQVTIYGEAEMINGDPAANADLDVYVIMGKNRRVIEVTTDENGEYITEFEPFSYESGHYIVGACYPGQGLRDEQDAFDILGMERASRDYLTWNLKKNVPVTGTVGIRNRSGVPLTNVSFEPLEIPDGFHLEIDTIPTLPGLQVENFNFTAWGEVITEGKNYIEVPVRVSSDEGISFEFKAYYYCQALGSHLVSVPSSINTTMTKGKTRYYDIRVINDGAGETEEVTIDLPDQEWMSLASQDTIENITSGDTITVTLMLAPDGDVPLNTPLSGRIVVHNSNGDDLAIPYRTEVVSEAKGLLRVDVVDEYTYFTDDAPHVENAHVVVRHPYSGKIVAEGFTDADGIFVSDSLNEGSYRMTVQADKHEGYQNVIVIDPGRVNEQSVFLSFQAISYTWEVVPTEIEDEYEVELVLEYETNVPAPVVRMEMPDVMPQLFNDETYTFLVTLTNEGLITAQDVELVFPDDHPDYEWITDYQVMDLLAQQAIQVPVTMQRRGSKSAFSGLKSDSKAGGGCSDFAITVYGFECGADYQWKQTNASFTFEGTVCPGNSGGGGNYTLPTGDGGTGPGGPGGTGGTSYDPYGGSASSVTPSTGCDPCLISTLQTILGCVGPPPAAALACGYGFADGDASWSDVGGCIPGPIGCTIGIIATIETCYNSPPFGPYGGGGSSGGKGAWSGSKSTSAPPIMLQAATEMEWAAYSDQAERDYVSEYMGDIDWTVKENFIDFTIATDANVTNKIPFDAAETTSVLAAMEDTDFTSEEVNYFITRWNLTLEAWDAGVTSPNTTYPDIVSQDSLDVYFARMNEARDYALDLGYSSVSEMRYEAWHTLKGETEDRRSSVCASVSIKISQKLVMTREAFEGTLTIFNGNTTTAMEEVKLNLEIRNQDGELANDLFEIETKALDILTGVDGTGSLGAEETGSATILFIPEKGAAPEVPVSYSFGGSFSYLDPFTGTTVEKPLFPVTLDVNPSPDLFLHYFMQRDILGDDPLTEPIEPIIPAELGLMIENNGFGTAKNVRIESAQPEIIDNEKGLAIHFELIGSNLDGEPTQLGLIDIDFGNIDPKSTKIGQWWFTADLLGHFVNYEANVTHLDSRGNPDLSLVSGAELHELIRSIRVYGDTDDGINDFLVNEYQDAAERPDAIYLSQGQQVLDVHAADIGYFEGDIRAPEFTNTLKVVNSRLGWNYVRLNDPGNGRYELVSVKRLSDQQEIPADNAWLTFVTLPDGNEPVYEDKFHFVDIFEDLGEQEYLVTWKLKDPDPPQIVKLEGAPDVFVSEPVTNIFVTFNKEIDPSTFTWEDMMLRLQGGDDIMDSTVSIVQHDAVTYEVDISQLTTGNGFYVLTVQAAGIQDTDGTNGKTGRQAAWTQFLDVPVVEEFIGIPEGLSDTAFNYILVRFNLPIDINTLVPSSFLLEKDGEAVDGDLEILQMDTDAKLFKLSGLEPMMDGEGAYHLTVDLPSIATIDGNQGLLEQSVGWSLDTTPPSLLSFTTFTDGGFDDQHVTAVDVLFSEAVTGFGLGSVELWRDDERLPLSQVHFDSLGMNTWQMNEFRLLTYYVGEYTLKVHMNTVFDRAGITGEGTVSHTWRVDRSPPAAVQNLSISPDLGYSDSDGITSTRNLNLLMDVPESGVTIEVYKNDFGTLTLLTDSVNVAAGPLEIPLQVTSPGNVLLEVHSVAGSGNFSTAQLPVVIDESAFRASFLDVPTEPVGDHPAELRVKFTDRIMVATLDMNSFSMKLNGNPVDLSVLTVQQVSDTVFILSGLDQLESRQGLYRLTLNLAGVEKYRSGLKGSYTASSEWTIRKVNTAPVADAGADFTMVPGETYQLDASGSYDPESDPLIIEWFPPDGITLDDPFSIQPSFTAPEADDSTEYTFLLSVSDGEYTVTNEVTALLLNDTWVEDLTGSGGLRLYPNPTKGVFTVATGELDVQHVRLVDVRGQVILDREWETGPEMILDLEYAPPGFYMVIVSTDDTVVTGRIVKE